MVNGNQKLVIYRRCCPPKTNRQSQFYSAFSLEKHNHSGKWYPCCLIQQILKIHWGLFVCVLFLLCRGAGLLRNVYESKKGCRKWSRDFSNECNKSHPEFPLLGFRDHLVLEFSPKPVDQSKKLTVEMGCGYVI